MTKNIGSVTKIKEMTDGEGPFFALGEAVYDDYWKFYLTKDMAKALEIERPYSNLRTYLEYKKRGMEVLTAHEDEILEAGGGEPPETGGDSE